jgi:3-phosphoglycerate kinase
MFKKVNLNYLSAYLNDTSRVVVRTDFNVPIKEGVIQDFTRLKSIFFIT